MYIIKKLTKNNKLKNNIMYIHKNSANLILSWLKGLYKLENDSEIDLIYNIFLFNTKPSIYFG